MQPKSHSELLKFYSVKLLELQATTGNVNFKTSNMLWTLVVIKMFSEVLAI